MQLINIGLIDVDSHNFPNLPLMKLSAYHKEIGNKVSWWNGFEHYDLVYMSKVFTDEYSAEADEPCNCDLIIKGGTGYGLHNKLPKVIENIYPDYSLYPQFEEAYGFLTRGCPRACKFCIVSQKEGRRSKQVANLEDFHRGQKTIKLLDPNLLACREHEKLLGQLINSDAWVDFTQGLDIRLINKDNVLLLNQVKTKTIHFAWDNPKEDLTNYFIQFNQFTTVKNFRKKRVYVLTNFNSNHDEDLYRIYTLCDLGYDPYVMIYDKLMAPRETRLLQRWVNNKIIFRAVDKFEDYNPKIG